MTFWAYMLRCADGSYYVGQTSDLDRRLAQHQSGDIAGYTQDRRPVQLVWSDSFQTRDEARTVEHRIEPWSRAKKEGLIAGDWAAVGAAAVPPSEKASRAAGASASVGGSAPRLRSGQGRATPDASDTMPCVERSRDTDPTSQGKAGISSPAIVLVRPQLGENIGKAARAMLNFGLTDLRLVAPRDGWPNPDAGPAASGADIVLQRARVFDSVAEAVADCTHVYATTVRKRGVVLPVVTPEAAAQAIHAGAGQSAILFGPERSGLETDDVAVARTIVTVPINPEFGSLNLAQAVILIAYEWSKGMALASPPSVEQSGPAPQAELDRLIGHLDGILEKAGYYFPPDRAHVDKRALRTILTSPGWNAGEVRTLRGILRSIERSQG